MSPRQLEIKTLWEEHLNVRYPKQCVGQIVEDIELMLLDSYTAGCVDTFLQSAFTLDTWRLAILGICYHDLAVATSALDGNESIYFERLRKIARLILQDVVANNVAKG